MTIYIPKKIFPIDGEGKEVCDAVCHVYYDRKDAELIHPGVPVWEIEVEDAPISDN